MSPGLPKPLFPDLPDDVFLDFVEKADEASRKDRGKLWVQAKPLLADDAHKRADPALFGAVFALQIDRSGRGWLLRGYIANTAQGAALTRVGVEGFPDATADVSGTALRDIPVATIRDRALARIGASRLAIQALREWGQDVAGQDEKTIKAAAYSAGRRRRRGPEGLGPDKYRQLARDYLEACARDDIPHAHAWLAKKHGRTEAAIRTRLVRAAEQGFLTGGRRGRRYQPGPNLGKEEEQ